MRNLREDACLGALFLAIVVNITRDLIKQWRHTMKTEVYCERCSNPRENDMHCSYCGPPGKGKFLGVLFATVLTLLAFAFIGFAKADEHALQIGEVTGFRGAVCKYQPFADAIATKFEKEGEQAGIRLFNAIKFCAVVEMVIKPVRIVREFVPKDTARHFTIVEVLVKDGSTHFILTTIDIKMAGYGV